jgi:LysM repeat protein
MKKFLTITNFLILIKISAQTWQTEDQYIQNFAPYAVEEMEKYKIPASITLAQGLLETAGGQSRLAQEGNNHFGIKCKEDWKGKTMKHTDDAPNECFRVYDNPKQSYEDHSIFLATRKYYANLFKLDMKDYEAWAHGLKKAGYATNPRYAYTLIDKIKKYKLYEFDNTTSKEVYNTILKLYPNFKTTGFINQSGQKDTNITTTPPTATVSYPQNSDTQTQKNPENSTNEAELLSTILVKNHPNGGIKFVIIPANTTVSFIAKKFDIKENKIIKWNELENNNLKQNDILFLESKKSSGTIDTYKVGVGETMHDIAQKFAVKLNSLYSKNRMQDGEQPKSGQLIYLREKKPRD